MSMGEVDTLGMLAEKLDNLFTDSQGYYESFLETNTLYKNGKLDDREFFQKMGDYIVAYSALEFLSIKVIMELKKALGKMAGGQALGGTQSASLMPGMTPGMMPGMAMPPRTGTAQNPVGPPGVVSTQDAFGQPGTLPTPDPRMISAPRANRCSSCGAGLGAGAKFCTKCGNRT